MPAEGEGDPPPATLEPVRASLADSRAGAGPAGSGRAGPDRRGSVTRWRREFSPGEMRSPAFQESGKCKLSVNGIENELQWYRIKL